MRKLILLLTFFIAALAAAPAGAYTYDVCRNPIKWPSNLVIWNVSSTSFGGTPWEASLNTARNAWNDAPGNNFNIGYYWTTDVSTNTSDGKNSILMPSNWSDGGALAVTYTRRPFCFFFSTGSHWQEADMLFNPNKTWDTSTNPPAPVDAPFNSTIVATHEHGHGLGLLHENDTFALMNEYYPGGGVVGTAYQVQPHADDVAGARNLYKPSTPYTVRDVAATPYRHSTSDGRASEPIPAPSAFYRGQTISFQFTVENRGNITENVPVYFYASATRQVTTSSRLLGTAQLSIPAGVSATPTLSVPIPTNGPWDYQYLGWIIDPLNSIPEIDEGNNGATLIRRTNFIWNYLPTACFTASATSGSTPFTVQVNASCSSDQDGSPLTYTWDFGDGNIATGVTASNTYWIAGTYDILLTVHDGQSAAYEWRRIHVSCNNTFCPEEPY
ncbi:MAG TPA: PKD domain-containing protein [Thermoanaerobaculia bacterium]